MKMLANFSTRVSEFPLTSSLVFWPVCICKYGCVCVKVCNYDISMQLCSSGMNEDVWTCKHKFVYEFMYLHIFASDKGFPSVSDSFLVQPKSVALNLPTAWQARGKSSGKERKTLAICPLLNPSSPVFYHEVLSVRDCIVWPQRTGKPATVEK